MLLGDLLLERGWYRDTGASVNKQSKNIKKTCTNVLHEGMHEPDPPHLFKYISKSLFLKNNTYLIEQVCSRSVDEGSFLMVNFEKLHPNFEEGSRKRMI